jgi:uncharacterized protein
MSTHPIVHVEFSATDHKESAEFYNKVFGWKVQHFDEMNYTTFATGDNEVGGGFNPAPENMPVGSTSVYIGTDDIDASLREIEAHGGKTVRPKDEIPGMGWFALFQDPGGNMVGLYTTMNQSS